MFPFACLIVSPSQYSLKNLSFCYQLCFFCAHDVFTWPVSLIFGLYHGQCLVCPQFISGNHSIITAGSYELMVGIGALASHFNP